MATIAEVAREAQVGVATVSRVLNGSPAVRDETRRRVLDAIARLGYAPNAAARALSTGRTRAIGVVAPFFTRPSVMERLRGVSGVLARAGYQLVLFDVERPGQRDEYFRTLPGGGRLDGLLSISMCPPGAELERFEAAGVPVVLVDHPHVGVPTVFTDDVAGGRLATEHLLALGHRRIAFLGDEEEDTVDGFTSSAMRRTGYEHALEAAGVELDEELVWRAPHGREPATALALELLRSAEPPTAIFAASIFVRMPPVPCALPAPPASASMHRLMRATSGTSRAARARIASATSGDGVRLQSPSTSVPPTTTSRERGTRYVGPSGDVPSTHQRSSPNCST